MAFRMTAGLQEIQDIYIQKCADRGETFADYCAYHDVDHVHILFRGQPNTEISKLINAYKSASSRIIKKDFP